MPVLYEEKASKNDGILLREFKHPKSVSLLTVGSEAGNKS